MSDTFTICFRIPNKLRAPLTKLAKANLRSINAEVVMAIEARVSGASAGHSDDCPSKRGGECVYPCYMQPTELNTTRSSGCARIGANER